MIHRETYPILEFDDNPGAVINPSSYPGPKLPSDKLIITFFPEVLEKLKKTGQIEKETTIPGEVPLEVFRFTEEPDVLITPGQIGCPACAGNLDLLQGMGIRKVMFCGGGGVLDSEIAVGRLLLVEGAVRDEGFSYHYVAPSRVIRTGKEVTDKIAAYLDENAVPYLRGLTWTTDAMFRETEDLVALRRAEGARMVEMEQAGCIAVAQVRKLAYGALVYGGDDLASGEWDDRGWRSRDGIRFDMVTLCRKLLRVI